MKVTSSSCGGSGSSSGSGSSTGSSGGSGSTSGSSGGSTSGSGGTGGTIIKHLVTFYGWPDNSPPGDAIAYPQIHTHAGGTGTWDDPITFATDKSEWAPGTKLYVPFIQRYVIMEDSCVQCISDWASGKRHIDLWMNSNGSFSSQVISCEDRLTTDGADVEVNPPSNRPVITTPLFNTSSGQCIQ